MGSGVIAPNPAEEVINFNTFVFSMRYGLASRLNIAATIPHFSINSDKFQGSPYERSNKGWGDLLVSAEFRIGTAPQLTLDAGLELPTGDIERTDEHGQRICDILALGSGTTDPVVGAGLWVPKFLFPHLDFFARVQHRFSGGVNKWGYRFGSQTAFSMHASHPLVDTWRVGLRLEGFNAEPDTWYGSRVPERGAKMLYAGPTLAARITENNVMGAFMRFPVAMELVGAQMVAPIVFGLELNTDVGNILRRLTAGDENEEDI